MPTKAELEAKIESLNEDLRRQQRAINQLNIDLDDLPPVAFNQFTAPHANEHAREAINRAHKEWDLVVKDPSSGERIDLYIKSSHGLKWSWEENYTRNGQFAWCGAFASWCYTDVKQPIRTKIFPSCYRMYKAWSNTSRRIDPMKVQPGDIVVIYTSKRSVQGDHITLCVDTSNINEGYINTIEGNAKGTLGNGEYGEGVIKQERTLDKIAHVYRLLGEDFNE
jgi:hypothetical protein